MNIKLICDKKDEELIRTKLNNHVNFVEDGDFILIDKKFYEIKYKQLVGYLNDSYSVIQIEDVFYFESEKDSVFAYTNNHSYLLREKLYELELNYINQGFLRVNKSCVVNVRKIKRIKPTINRKFILTMENNQNIDVTRTYYLIFKEYFGL